VIGLGLAMAGFLIVIVTTFARRNRAAFERARWLPLEDDGAPLGRGERRGDD